MKNREKRKRLRLLALHAERFAPLPRYSSCYIRVHVTVRAYTRAPPCTAHRSMHGSFTFLRIQLRIQRAAGGSGSRTTSDTSRRHCPSL